MYDNKIKPYSIISLMNEMDVKINFDHMKIRIVKAGSGIYNRLIWMCV